MRIRLAIDDVAPVGRSLRDAIAERRERIVVDVARRALARIIDETPVETGRLRAAWIGALAELGGAGSTGSPEGTARIRETASVLEIEIENAVPYAAAVEYGTRGRAGEHIIVRALQGAAGI
ncbi:MAG: HK97 gp10 family phage protein [Planctomycetaceae bacterium]